MERKYQFEHRLINVFLFSTLSVSFIHPSTKLILLCTPERRLTADNLTVLNLAEFLDDISYTRPTRVENSNL